jgi:hypothetical protein
VSTGIVCKLVEAGNNLREGDASLEAGSPHFDFDDPIGQPFIANDELKRRSNQVGVVEFDAGSLCSVVP